MRQTMVYDLPTRVFHWFFAGLFVTAFFIAKTVDDESATYAYHMLAGMTLSFVVLLRIIWGFVGSRYARFSEFALKPADLVSYFKGLLTGDKRVWAGHNPASSWAAIIMMVQALGLGITGYLMASSGNEDAFEDLHELLANSFLIVALLHVSGVVLHTIRHRDMIGISMLDGKKAGVEASGAIPSARSAFGLLMLGLIVAFGINLFKGYDAGTGTLHAFGTTLQLGESEGNDGQENEDGGEAGKGEDDDDDGDDD